MYTRGGVGREDNTKLLIRVPSKGAVILELLKYNRGIQIRIVS